MLKLKDMAGEGRATKLMVSSLRLSSSASREWLVEQPMMCGAEQIGRHYDRLRLYSSVDALPYQALLGGLRSIAALFNRLSRGASVCELDLFYIKQFAIMVQAISLLPDTKLIAALPDLSDVVDVLDPDRTATSSFYLYDSYDPRLAPLRKEVKENEEVREQLMTVEHEVLKRLSERLRCCAERLKEAFEMVAEMDVMFAKALQTKELKLTIPQVATDGQTRYKGLFNIAERERLEQEGKVYEPVDFTLDGRKTVVVGANMGGKSVTMEALRTAQTAFQFGFGVAAEQAVIEPKECTILYKPTLQAVGSSFEGEIVALNNILLLTRRYDRMLLIMDEPLISTNPVEGKALVEGFVELVESKRVDLVVVTHLNVDTPDSCRRLMVNGYEEGRMNYSYTEVRGNDVPKEALAAARRLGVEEEWIELTIQKLKHEQK